jgi:hypothetical protein
MELFRLIEKFILEHPADAMGALATYMGLIENRPEARSPSTPGALLLQHAGLVRVRKDRLEVKCPLFERHFDMAWADRCFSQAGTPVVRARTANAGDDPARRQGCGAEFAARILAVPP